MKNNNFKYDEKDKSVTKKMLTKFDFCQLVMKKSVYILIFLSFCLKHSSLVFIQSNCKPGNCTFKIQLEKIIY